MKYIVVLGDGMADRPLSALGGKTPLEAANKPAFDALAQKGEVGLCKTVPDGMKAGSDVANLSVMGYDPRKCYTGRSPIEAASMGIALKDDDLAVRCNLVTLEGDGDYARLCMKDYSAGEISSEEAAELIKAVDDALGSDRVKFFAGVSYRHCAVFSGARTGTELTPPHDISDRRVGGYLPSGVNGAFMLELMEKSREILSRHPINESRIKRGLNPANSIWLWGEGTRLALEPFERLFGLKGAVISAVDLVKGIGVCAGMEVVEVEGATGKLDTDFEGKARACLAALEKNDYVYVHMEAPDECGHQGDAAGKVAAIEAISERVAATLIKELKKRGEAFRMLVMPDHPTPVSLKTHTPDSVPFAIYDSRYEKNGVVYDERHARETGLYFDSGEKLAGYFTEKQADRQSEIN